MKSFKLNIGWVHDDYLSFINKQTPECNLKWKNVQATRLDNYDFNVVCGAERKKNLDLKNSIHFRREPDIICKWKQMSNSLYSYDYSTNEKFHASTWWIPDSYSDLSKAKYIRKKQVSVVASNKHVHRVNYINNVSKSNKNLVVKGNICGPKVSLPERSIILKESSMSICIENSSQKNYFTEKIIDCLLSWTLPVYWGCPNIHDFFPVDSYRLIDINKPEELSDIINQPITSTEIDAMEVARRLILDKYNIWNCIHTAFFNYASEV
jgi:hypothetical protein